jgi:2-octaprenyl-6-methoxyphenol hydroxylase
VALARESRGGLRVAVIERGALATANAQPDARASALSLGSKNLLDTIGVWPALAPDAQPVTAIDITDSSLGDAFRQPVLSYDNTLDGTPATWIVENPRISDALRTAARAAPGVTLLDHAEIATCTPGPHTSTVTLQDGRTLSSSLVVACDGRRSALREAAGLKTVGWDYPQTGIVTTVSHEKPHHGRAIQHFLPAGPFAILPLPGNRACITWTEDATEARRILALDDKGFHAEIEKRFGLRLGELTLDGPRQSWPLEMHLARTRIAPRLALAGDAACGVHPIACQGLNLGLRDVAALTEVIVDTARLGLDIGSQIALQKYERWRRADAALAAGTFDALNRLFSTDATILRTTRDVGLGLVDRAPALKRFFVAEAAGQTGDVPKLLRRGQTLRV